MRGSARVLVIVIGFASLSLTAYARFAPLDAPESRGAVPGTVVLDARVDGKREEYHDRREDRTDARRHREAA